MVFDLAIIGGGPAGYTAAAKAAKMGKTVVLFEKSHLGGVCLNEGCIPTKTLLFSSKVYQTALNGKKFAVSSENVTFDYEKIVARKNKVVRKLNAGIRAKMSNDLITVVEGEASVVSAANVVFVACGETTFQATNLLLCTGSVSVVPPIKGLSESHFWTSREALEAKQLPESITIIGGGVIGMEFASLYSAFGVPVTVIEMADEILPGIDREIAALLRAEYVKKNVHFQLASRVTEVTESAVTFVDENGQNTINSDKILVCVGRKPKMDSVETLALEFSGKSLKINSLMQTSIANIYAAGDITGVSMLAHTAVREAEVAVNNMFDKPDTMSYTGVPAVIYTTPEVASVGKSEEALKAEGVRYIVYKKPMTYAGRFVAENEGFEGLCKLITDEKSVLLGAHLIGNPASELIAVASMAIETQMTIEQFHKIIFPHPSVSEIFKETLD